jgi:hypothetical protein
MKGHIVLRHGGSWGQVNGSPGSSPKPDNGSHPTGSQVVSLPSPLGPGRPPPGTYPVALRSPSLNSKQYGPSWFDKLLAQNPRWVRGTATPGTLIRQANSTLAASFASGGPLTPSSGNINNSWPVEGSFVSWPQTGAILKDAPHPEGAKLLHSYILTEYQSGGWSVRTDVPPPPGFPDIFNMPGTNVAGFSQFMSDRGRVERLRFWFESRIGSAQGLSPLIDNL